MVDSRTDQPSFGQWLRHRRRELDLTQAELARQVGCAPITVRKLEADQMRPSKQLAELLLERMGVPAEEWEGLVHFARGGEPTELVTVLAPKHNLPHPVSSFIGREREIVDIQGLLSTSRLVTLTGVGGCGKSRLALEVARGLVDTIGNGVWWVELAALTVDSLVPQAVARTLGLREAPNQEMSEILVNSLRNKRLLLVIDNCEHLTGGCAELSERLLQECPNLGILATSREPLAIGGEAVYQVPPLSLPEANETSPRCVLKSEAARMFVERAEAIKPDFSLNEQNVAAIVQICRRLDGIPLAIELAAARVRLLTVEHVAERLDDRFNLLTSGSRTALPRQQTLRATIDWSYELLSEKTKTLFRRLSVFAGGSSLSATEAVCSDEHLMASEVLPELSRLVDRSLVEVVQKGEQERYRMLETIRLYAVEKLQESGEEARMRDRHLKYFTEWAEQVEPKLRGPEQMRWWDQMEIEHDNIRSALGWSLGGGDVHMGLRLAGAASWFWDPRGHYWREGLEWLKEILARIPPQERTSARAKALLGAGVLAFFDLTTAEPVQDWFTESLEIWREVGDQWRIADALVVWGWYLIYTCDPGSAREKFEEAVAHARRLEDEWILGVALKGLGGALERSDYSEARPVLEECVAVWRNVGIKEGLADALNMLGTVAHGQGNEEQAITLYEESLRLFDEVGSTAVAMVLENLGTSVQACGDNERAARLFKEALTLDQEIGYFHGSAWALAGLGGVAGEQHEPKRAARLLGAAQAWRKSVGENLSAWPYVLNDYARWEKTARAQLDEEAFVATYAEGQAMTLEQAVKYALEDTKEDGFSGQLKV